jgi:hypothetical protein
VRLSDKVVQVSAPAQLQHHVNVSVVLVYVLQSGHVETATQAAQHFHLTLHSLHMACTLAAQFQPRKGKGKGSETGKRVGASA